MGNAGFISSTVLLLLFLPLLYYYYCYCDYNALVATFSVEGFFEVFVSHTTPTPQHSGTLHLTALTGEEERHPETLHMPEPLL